MGDVAQIMAAAAAAAGGGASASTDPSPFKRRGGGLDAGGEGPGAGPSSAAASRPPPKKAKLNRELAGILGPGGAGEGVQEAPPIMPTRALALGGLKARRDAKRAKRWVWKAFANSARKDGALFCHWVRADAEPLEYPFARFNRKLEIVRYTDAEVSGGWKVWVTQGVGGCPWRLGHSPAVVVPAWYAHRAAGAPPRLQPAPPATLHATTLAVR